MNKDKKKRNQSINKYCFVMDYEPFFPDIRKAFRKFGHILKNDKEMKEVFPYGVHFQVSEKRSSKNYQRNTSTINSCTIKTINQEYKQ